MNRRELLGALAPLPALPLLKVARIIDGKTTKASEKEAGQIEVSPGQFIVLVAYESGIEIEEFYLPKGCAGWAYRVQGPIDQALRIYKIS